MKLRWAVLPLSLAGALAPQTAEAHFHLIDPPSWLQENALGNPQKDAPCGGEGAHTLSNIVTTFRPGQVITVRWQETIYHPGHWRIAIAENRADLPEPQVTTDANQLAVSATIVDPPVLPILADNLFPVHGSGSNRMLQFDVTLPNITCAHCTLQVIQFMEGHGPPNYIYHHCADIALVPDAPDAGPTMDATMDVDLGVTDDAGGAPPPQDAAVQDLGVVPDDTGVTTPDVGPVDSGQVEAPDSGQVEAPDSGTSAGDASVRDQGIGAVDPKLSGCGCTATNAPGALLEGALAAALLVFLSGRSGSSIRRRSKRPSGARRGPA
ncbi:MAG: SCE4755 family polysaccharide monooxygenase-like protein [Myxococcota bacterium]